MKELEIRVKDWVFIVGVGVLFGLLLSLLFYILNQDLKRVQTLYFGSLVGLFISSLSTIFISISNQFILPRVDRVFWIVISFIFSFLAGFLGLYIPFYLIELNFKLLSENLLLISTLSGILTYLIGLILYKFISFRNEKEMLNHSLIESRLKFLELQINPHFIFNMLNSIAELIHIDRDRAEESVIKLSKFFRGALDKSSMIELKDELEFVQNYLYLENIKHTQRLILNIDRESNLNFQVPKFSIQLLVENSIKHGLIQDRDLHIKISISDREVNVIDDGAGFESLKMGVGLKNLKERLKLLTNGELRAISRDGVTKFTIKL